MLGFRTRFWVNAVGRVAPLVVSFAVTFSAATEFQKLLTLGGAVFVLIAVEYIGVVRPLRDLEGIVRKQFDFFFQPFVDRAEFMGQKADIRINVMLVKWFWFRRHLYQYYQIGMKGFPDSDLHFSIKRGASGRALAGKMEKVYYRDLRNDSPDRAKRRYKWSQKELEAVQHVLAVAVIPLCRERKTLRGHIRYQYIGTLNVDATNNEGADLLANPDIQQQIRGFAAFVQISLG